MSETLLYIIYVPVDVQFVLICTYEYTHKYHVRLKLLIPLAVGFIII